MDLALISRKVHLEYTNEAQCIQYLFDLPVEDSVRIEKQTWKGKTTWKLLLSNQDQYYDTRLCASSTLADLITKIKQTAAKNSNNCSWWNQLFHPHQPVFQTLATLLEQTATWIE